MAEQVSSLKTGIKYKNTPIGNIPVDWEVKKLGDTASNEKYSFTGGPFGSDLKEDSYTDDGVRVIQLQNIGDGKFFDEYKIFTSEEKANQLKNCNIYPGDIIIAKMADPVARACIIPDVDKRYLMASDGIRLLINKEKYDVNFMLYAVNSPNFRKNAESHSTGSTRLRIGLTELRNLLIAIPPLREQKKIAEILTTVDEAIEKTDQIIEKTKEAKKGLMQRLFTHGIGHKKFKKTEIGEIPEEWDVKRVKEIGEVITGNTPSTKIKDYYGDDYMFVTPADMNDFKYVKTTARMLSDAGIKVSRKVPKNSVLVVCIASIGKIAMAFEDCSTNQQINTIICNEKVNPHFIYYLMISKISKISSLSGKTAVPIVNKSLFSELLVQIPHLTEQQKIAEILSCVDEEIEKDTKHQEQLESFKNGLMQVLLTGKVRVSV